MRTIIRFLIVVATATIVACAVYFVLPGVGSVEALTYGAGGTTYVVRRGDTLSAIARRYGVTTSAIIKANNIRNPSRIVVGQRLWIPKTAKVTPPPAKPAPFLSTPEPPDPQPSLIPTTRPP